MSDSGSLSGDFLSETGARFLYYAASGLVIVFLSRQLQPSAYGQLFLAMSVLTVGRLFSSMGLAKSAAKHISQYQTTDKSQIRYVVLWSLRSNLVSIGVVAIVVILTADALAAGLGNPAIAPLLVIGSLYIITATVYNYGRVVLQGFRDIRASAAVYASEGVGRIAGVLLLVSLGYGITGALVGYILGFLIAAVFGLWLVYKRVSMVDEQGPAESGLLKRILRYSLPLTVTRGAWVLDREIDIILVGYFLNPAVVGYYVISKQIVTFSTGPAGSIGFSIGPQFTESTITDDADRARETYEAILQYVLLFYIPAVAGLIILAEPVVTGVFGRRYQDVVPILQVFCAGIVLIAVTTATEDILDYIGRAKARAVFKIATSIGNVVLTVILLEFLAAIGAAIATVCMQLVYASLCLYVIRDELGLRTKYLLHQASRIIIIAVATSAVALVLLQFVDGVVSVGAAIFCGAVVWVLLSVFGGFIDPQDIRHQALSKE